MNNRVTARYDRFKRQIAFRDARLALFPAGSKAAEEFALVEVAITDMDEAEGKQAGGKQTGKGGTVNKTVVLDDLHLDMLNIARTARSIADKEKNPGFAELFRMPASPGEAALLVAARLFKTNATPVVAKFVAYDLSADILTHMGEDLAAIETANKQQDTGLDNQTGGTEAIDVAVRNGLDAADQLNTIMQNKFSRDAENLRAWNVANHTERPPRRAKQPPPPTPPAK